MVSNLLQFVGAATIVVAVAVMFGLGPALLVGGAFALFAGITLEALEGGDPWESDDSSSAP